MKEQAEKIDAFNRDILPLVKLIGELAKKHDIPCMMSFDVDDDRAVPNRLERHVSAIAICRNPSTLFAQMYDVFQKAAPYGIEPERLLKAAKREQFKS